MQLTSIEDIERAIERLTPAQIEELYQWLDRHHPQPIDSRLRADLEAGHVDERIVRAIADCESGETQPL